MSSQVTSCGPRLQGFVYFIYSLSSWISELLVSMGPTFLDLEKLRMGVKSPSPEYVDSTKEPSVTTRFFSPCKSP